MHQRVLSNTPCYLQTRATSKQTARSEESETSYSSLERILSTKRPKIPAISSPSQHTSLPSLHQALHHPNIVSLYAVVRTPLDCFHVLEFCSQGNLFEYRRSLDTMTWKDTEVRRVLKGLVDALLFLKREGIVHRDLNPYNVLLTDNLVTVCVKYAVASNFRLT